MKSQLIKNTTWLLAADREPADNVAQCALVPFLLHCRCPYCVIFLQAALALYYTHVGGGKVGEPWDHWSWLQAVGFAVFAAGAYLYNRGHKQQDEEEATAGKAPVYSKWAVLKSTLSISTGHRVAARRFRVAGTAALAGVRARRMADGLDSIAEGYEP